MEIIFRKRRLKDGNSILIYDDKIICRRPGSRITKKKDSLMIDADPTGIEKVYFSVSGSKVLISEKFKFFKSAPIDPKLTPIQEKMGYVPFPFTIKKGVFKAPPGLITTVSIKNRNKPRISYAPSPSLKIFSQCEFGAKKEFRRRFESVLKDESRKIGPLVSSFSGGFDSLLLTKVLKQKISKVLHFSEDSKVDISYFSEIFDSIPWILCGNTSPFTQKDADAYFSAVDEPCCDPSGFAEYIMIRELSGSGSPVRSLPIMNGQSCDGDFCYGRKYFQESLFSRMPLLGFIRIQGGRHNKNKALSRLYNYTATSQGRFEKFYLGDSQFEEPYLSAFRSICKTYRSAIKNDSANKLAALVMLLRYPLYEVEKIKTASRSFGVRYFLPFMSCDMVRLAFSIPSSEKVGFLRGKQILIKAYPDIASIRHISRDFIPQKLKQRLMQEPLTEEKYKVFFFKRWLEMNPKKR